MINAYQFRQINVPEEGLKILGQLEQAGLESHSKKPVQGVTVSLKRLKASMNAFNDRS